jgi:hypothetical protein
MARIAGVGGGFTLLDGVALVIGAAVASVHLRALTGARLGGALVLFWMTFAGVALTSAGPFLFLGRRFLRRSPGYPGVGDRLWGVLGLPWMLTAVLSTGTGGPGASAARGDVYATALGCGLAASCVTALATVWKRWVMAPPQDLDRRHHAAWTDRVGLALAVAWPLQCGFGLLIIG